jgi:hypothetical protein
LDEATAIIFAFVAVKETTSRHGRTISEAETSEEAEAKTVG